MKLGLGDSYDKTLVNKKLRAYADLTKPASSIGAFCAFLAASLFYFYYTGKSGQIGSNWMTIIYSSFTIFLAHSASQTMNMAEDAEMDRQTPHKQNRPIPAGIVSEEEARTIAWILSAFALARGFMVSPDFGFMVMILLWFGVFYNLDPIRAKERIISIPWQSVSRGLLPFPAVWAAYGNIFAIEPWVLGLFMYFYVMGFQNSADIIDEEIDREFGISTFIVEYGVDGTMRIASGCMGAMATVIGFSVLLGIFGVEYLWMLLILPFCLVMLYYMWRYPYRVSNKTGNHPAWLWFYFGLVLCVSTPLGIAALA